MTDHLKIVGGNGKDEGVGPDPFNFAAYRVQPAYEQDAGIRKQLTTVPVRKPKSQEWIRVHPDKRQDCGFILLEEGREYYLVNPDLHDALQNEMVTCTLYVAINTAGVVFLWPAKRLWETTHRSSDWLRSAHEAAAAAMLRRVRVRSNMSLQAYEIDYSDNPGPEPDPVWPDKSLPELAEIAFKKTGRLIDTLDHSVIKYLRGRV